MLLHHLDSVKPCDKGRVTQLSHVEHQGVCDKNNRRDSKEDDENLVQELHQCQPEQQQLKKPTLEVIEPIDNEHVLLTIKRSWKGANAEHEVTYRVKLSKIVYVSNNLM